MLQIVLVLTEKKNFLSTEIHFGTARYRRRHFPEHRGYLRYCQCLQQYVFFFRLVLRYPCPAILSAKHGSLFPATVFLYSMRLLLDWG